MLGGVRRRRHRARQYPHGTSRGSDAECRECLATEVRNLKSEPNPEAPHYSSMSVNSSKWRSNSGLMTVPEPASASADQPPAKGKGKAKTSKEPKEKTAKTVDQRAKKASGYAN